MRDEPLAVARSGAPQRQQADAGRWCEDVEHQGAGHLQSGDRCGGDEPARQAQQAHAHEDGQRRQRGAQGHATRRPGEHGPQRGQQGRCGGGSTRHAILPGRAARHRQGR
ncbi:hypothetical protein SDC9_183554 [bioreactor metagenome]|uniref:Uncharacterized protein n=1 Tax=bioreactor metagenome TaxID=1076179 RepID=A0A645HD45_9ZZZZ